MILQLLRIVLQKKEQRSDVNPKVWTKNLINLLGIFVMKSLLCMFGALFLFHRDTIYTCSYVVFLGY